MKLIKKIELVSPAGNWDSLIASINAGADAVYLGYNKYSARAYADNFDLKMLKKAVNTAHDYGVKVYIALNTLIKDSEIKDVLLFLNEYLSFCNDGIILQDLGLFYLIKSLFLKEIPDIRIHASTQLNIHNLKSVEFLKELDFKRVILAREMTLEEIKNITEKNLLEIEIFAHGACCYSYSGSCYFSSFTGVRSGNRGRCTQPCRMKYKVFNSKFKDLFSEELYILSKSDLFTLNLLPKIILSGVNALKIEGRMKTADYVGIITKIYRKYIDLCYKLFSTDYDFSKLQSNNAVFSGIASNIYDFKIDNKDLFKIMQVFSRNLYEGYFLDKYPSDIIFLKKSGSTGNFLGRITSVEKNANSMIIELKSNWEVNTNDILEIWTKKGNEQVKVNEVVFLGQKSGKFLYAIRLSKNIRCNLNDRVFKIFDVNLDEEAKSLYKNGIIKKKIINKIATNIEIDIKLNEFKKSVIKNIDISLKNIIKDKNNTIKDEAVKTVKTVKDVKAVNHENNFSIAVEIYSANHLKELVKYKPSYINYIVINDFNYIKDIDTKVSIKGSVKDILNLDISNFDNVFIKLPQIVYDEQLNNLKNIILKLLNIGFKGFSISNFGVLKVINEICLVYPHKIDKKINILVDWAFNLFNSFSVKFFLNLPNLNLNYINFSYFLISPELDLLEVKTIIDNNEYVLNKNNLNKINDIKLGVYSYGYIPVMISRINNSFLKQLFQNKNNYSSTKKHSYNLIDNNSLENCYYLEDKKGYKFKIDFDWQGNLVFLNSKKICNLFDLEDFFNKNIVNFYLDSRTLNINEIINLITYYKKAAYLLQSSKRQEFALLLNNAINKNIFKEYTRGHFYRKVI